MNRIIGFDLQGEHHNTMRRTSPTSVAKDERIQKHSWQKLQ